MGASRAPGIGGAGSARPLGPWPRSAALRAVWQRGTRDACYEEAAEGFGATARRGEEPRPWRGCSRGSSRRLLRKDERKCKRSMRCRKTLRNSGEFCSLSTAPFRMAPPCQKVVQHGGWRAGARGPGALNSPRPTGERWEGFVLSSSRGELGRCRDRHAPTAAGAHLQAVPGKPGAPRRSCSPAPEHSLREGARPARPNGTAHACPPVLPGGSCGRSRPPR